MIDLTKEEAAALLCNNIELLEGLEYILPDWFPGLECTNNCPNYNSETVKCKYVDDREKLLKSAFIKLKAYIEKVEE